MFWFSMALFPHVKFHTLLGERIVGSSGDLFSSFPLVVMHFCNVVCSHWFHHFPFPSDMNSLAFVKLFFFLHVSKGHTSLPGSLFSHLGGSKTLADLPFSSQMLAEALK